VLGSVKSTQRLIAIFGHVDGTEEVRLEGRKLVRMTVDKYTQNSLWCSPSVPVSRRPPWTSLKRNTTISPTKLARDRDYVSASSYRTQDINSPVRCPYWSSHVNPGIHIGRITCSAVDGHWIPPASFGLTRICSSRFNPSSNCAR
jgi:hypothetical protein